MAATLVRRLGLWSSIGLVIGITIGGGIFRTPGRHRDAGARPGVDARRVGARRIDRPLRRAGLRRALGVDARDRRHVRLPARRLGPPGGLSLRVGAARPDSRRRARRHLVGLRRILPARHRHRSRRCIPTGPTISLPAPSSSPASQHRRRPARRAVRGHLDDREVRRAGAARGRVVPAMGGSVGGIVRATSRRPAGRSMRGCSAWR